MENKQGLLVFETTNQALKTERILKGAEIPCTVVPTPSEITVDCGIALLLGEAWLDRASRALESSGCEGYRMLYPFERKDA